MVHVKTISKTSNLGNTFSFSYGFDSDSRKYYIVEDDCGVPRTKQKTIKTINDMLDELIKEDEDYYN